MGLKLRDSVMGLRVGAKILPTEIIGGAGIKTGNTYYVIKKTAPYYGQFVNDFGVDYSDGTNSICADNGVSTSDPVIAALNTGIQDALDKCVANRGDYVIIMPSQDDYDIAVALTCTKKGVHIICPEGLGNEIGSAEAARIHQLSSATIFAVANTAIEIAGITFKNYAGKSAITLAATANGVATYGQNIHNNTFKMTVTTAPNEPMILGTSDGGAWGSIERNWFAAYAGTGQTVASVISLAAQATSARIRLNEFSCGDANTYTTVISNLAVKGRTDFNTISRGGGTGGLCTITKAITMSAEGACIGNFYAGLTTTFVTGNTADSGLVENYSALNGGTVATS